MFRRVRRDPLVWQTDRMFQDLAKRPAAIASTGAVITCAWLLVTNWDPIRAGHPTYLVYYVGLMAVGSFVAIRWLRNPERERRLWLSLIGALVVVGLTVVAIWIRPFGATESGLEAMQGSDAVSVSQTGSRILMEPDGDPVGGLVFYPGARVDARAYANILTPVVEAGWEVVIVKPPFGIAFFSTSFAERWIEERPSLDTWAVGGHSLGGVVAASAADRDRGVDALVLYASFPASDISRADVDVVSIYGLDDGIAAPEDIEASRSDLPASAELVPLDGVVHSDFGDYGIQPGDGRPTLTKPDAQELIADATLELLAPLS